MIYRLVGKLIAKDGGRVAVDVNGVAYEVSLALSSYALMPAIGESVELLTHFTMREDGVSLYGFLSAEEKALFLQLNTVSKIGPKMALTILGNIGATELVALVTAQDVDRLVKVPGIGRKTAERIIVELKDKLKGFACGEAMFTVPKSVREDVVSALCNLGYKVAECEKIVSRFDDEDFNILLRKSLAELAG